jgi:hypothetical protein
VKIQPPVDALTLGVDVGLTMARIAFAGLAMRRFWDDEKLLKKAKLRCFCAQHV